MLTLSSWFITTLGVSSFFFTGRVSPKLRYLGWVLALAMEILWFTYAYVTKQWAFVTTPPIYSVVEIYNIITIRKVIHGQSIESV